MEINNISFKSSLLNQMQQKSVAATPAVVKNDSFELQNPKQKKNINKKTLIASIAGAIVLAIAIVKRKAINNFLKKLFDKTKSQTDEIKQGREKATTAAAETKAAEKIELPKPNFTCGPENPVQFAKEKKQYIDSIWDEYLHVDLPYVKFNKEKNILGLKALQKYGTTEDLRRLPDEYIICKDSDIFLEYAKLVNKVGSDKADDIQYSDFVNLNAVVDRRDNTYSMDVMEEIMDALKKHWVDDAPKGKWTNAGWNTLKDYEHYIRKAQEEGRSQMASNARAIFDRIVEDNPWMANKVAREMPQYAKK